MILELASKCWSQAIIKISFYILLYLYHIVKKTSYKLRKTERLIIKLSVKHLRIFNTLVRQIANFNWKFQSCEICRCCTDMAQQIYTEGKWGQNFSYISFLRDDHKNNPLTIYHSISKGNVFCAIEIVSKKRSKILAENTNMKSSNYCKFANNMYYILQMDTDHNVVS